MLVPEQGITISTNLNHIQFRFCIMYCRLIRGWCCTVPSAVLHFTNQLHGGTLIIMLSEENQTPSNESETELHALSESQRAAVRTYCSVTESESLADAVHALSVTNWNVQDALEQYLNRQVTNGDEVVRGQNVASIQSSQSVVRARSNITLPQRRRTHWLLRLLLSPLRVLWALFRRFNFSLWRLFGGHARALAEAGRGPAWERFKTMYEARHGATHPRFFEGSLLSAVANAQSEAAFVLVYLHSESHSSTRSFCARILAHPSFIAATDSIDIVFWAGDVAQRDGAAAQTALRAAGFPYLALVNPPSQSILPSSSNNSLPPLSSQYFGRVLTSLTAPYTSSVSVEDTTAWLQTSITTHRALLDRVREARASRARDRRIIAEQDLEYQESLRADRERERLAREEQERTELEEKRLQEREIRRRRKKETFGNEPEKGIGICSIMLRLPNGTRVQRRFGKDEFLERVFDWAEVNCVDIEVACLVSQYPRKRFRYPEDANVTLDAAGLFPSAALMLEERLDDE